MAPLTPLQILDQVRVAKSAGKASPAVTAGGPGVRAVGAPPHLAPGQRVVDPETGLEGEVIAYGRTHTIAPPTGGGRA